MTLHRTTSGSGRFDYLRLTRLVRGFRVRGYGVPQEAASGTSGATRPSGRFFPTARSMSGRLA